MTSGKLAKHRLETRPLTPVDNLVQADQLLKFSRHSVAAATATGIALTASIAGAASAAGNDVAQPVKNSGIDVLEENLTAAPTGNIASVDQEWDPGDEVAAVADEPAAVDAAVDADVDADVDDTADVASRGEDRAALTSDVPPVSVDTSSIAAAAISMTGIPYVYGGATPAGMDCSGLVVYVFAQFGINLPHQSEAIYSSGTVIPSSERQPGDVIYYPGHVAIYVGDDSMVEATVPGALSTVSPVRGGGTYVRI